MPRTPLVYEQVLNETQQSHATRRELFTVLSKHFGRPVVTLFTSFRYPVTLEDDDADMLEGVLRSLDLSSGLALCISSPGGNGLAAERIVNLCRNYSGTGEYWAIVPGKAKSAGTMVCFGASKIIMGPTSELGPVDPQLIDGDDFFSVYNVITSYEDLFRKAIKEKGNLQPYLQQLAIYDAREIAEMRAQQALSEDISVRVLASGMMSGTDDKAILKKIKTFLTPERTKAHGRPIYPDEAKECGLAIDKTDPRASHWECVYDLYIRTNHFVQTAASKCIESQDHSYSVAAPY